MQKAKGKGRRAKNSGEGETMPEDAQASLVLLARQHTALALQTLVDVATASGSDAARVSAALALLDRAFGKPKSAVEPKKAETLTKSGVLVIPPVLCIEEWENNGRK